MSKQQVQETKTQLPSDTSYEDQYAGMGTFTKEEHTITPRISILQGGSPQVKKQNASYVEGAQPGMIYLDSYPEPLISGDEGILFQPCWFETRWEVRTPKETGQSQWVGEFDEPQPDWTKHKSEKGNYIYYITPDGNVANEIHFHAGLLHLNNQLLPYSIRMGSTSIFPSKKWNGTIASRKTAKGEPAARFNYLYRMKVRSQTNAAHEWGQWNINPGGVANPEQMDRGAKFFMALKERKAVIAGGPDEHEGSSSPRTQADESEAL